MFKWKKFGKIFDSTSNNSNEWMQEYAQLPFPYILNDKVVRVYLPLTKK